MVHSGSLHSVVSSDSLSLQRLSLFSLVNLYVLHSPLHNPCIFQPISPVFSLKIYMSLPPQTILVYHRTYIIYSWSLFQRITDKPIC